MIDAAILARAGIDYAAGLERFMQDEDLYRAVLTAFMEDTVLARAREAYLANAPAALLRAAHEAKGSCGSAGLDRVSGLANRLVALLRRGSFSPEELKAAYTDFEAAYIAARDAVSAALG